MKCRKGEVEEPPISLRTTRARGRSQTQAVTSSNRNAQVPSPQLVDSAEEYEGRDGEYEEVTVQAREAHNAIKDASLWMRPYNFWFILAIIWHPARVTNNSNRT